MHEDVRDGGRGPVNRTPLRFSSPVALGEVNPFSSQKKFFASTRPRR